MGSKRRSYEAGHKRKYLVVIDDTQECDRAVYWAAKRAGRTKSQIVMLRVIESGDPRAFEPVEARSCAMFIQTEATPNPATLKFLPGRLVLESGTLDLPTKEAAARSPLAAKLFDVPNVSGVFFGSDFISVTKTDGDWQQMKPAILGAIMEHYMSGAELLSDDAKSDEAIADEFFDPKDSETVATIKDLIETRVRPAVASDGGELTFPGHNAV